MRRSLSLGFATVGCAVLGLFAMAAGYACGAIGWFNGVETPDRSFVPCGPAVFGRPDPLPDPACAAAYVPMPQLTWLLIGFGVVLVSASALLLTSTILSLALDVPERQRQETRRQLRDSASGA